jgi:hypothetical protein
MKSGRRALLYALRKRHAPGIDPHAYLLRTLYAAIARPGAVIYPDEPLVSIATT